MEEEKVLSGITFTVGQMLQHKVFLHHKEIVRSLWCLGGVYDATSSHNSIGLTLKWSMLKSMGEHSEIPVYQGRIQPSISDNM